MITDMTRNSGMVRRLRLIYGIIVFGLRKGSGIHPEGFRMFPEMFGYENTLFGLKGKAHRFLESAKGSFAESRGQMPGSLASESEKDSCLSGETDFVEAFTPRFDPKAQHINRGVGLAPKTHQETPSRVPATPSPLVCPPS